MDGGGGKGIEEAFSSVWQWGKMMRHQSIPPFLLVCSGMSNIRFGAPAASPGGDIADAFTWLHQFFV